MKQKFTVKDLAVPARYERLIPFATDPESVIQARTRTTRYDNQDPTFLKATVIVVSTNDGHHLKRCLSSVEKLSYPDVEILLVDNASTDGSASLVKRYFPKVTVIRNEENLGYAGANNIGFRHASGEIVAVLNPDTEVDANWLRELATALMANPSAGLVTSKILMMNDPARINACGNEITLTGLTVCRGFGETADAYEKLEEVSAVSGAAFAIRQSTLKQLGGFDEAMFLYYEDTDLSLRTMLAGAVCLYVPTSIAFHQYEFRFSPQKSFYLERNRILSWLKVFRWRTLIIMMPLILAAEVLVWSYALLKGPAFMVNKLRANVWPLLHVRKVLAARNEVQSTRKATDRQILDRLTHRLTFNQMVNQYLATRIEMIVQPLLFAAGKVCRALIAW